MAKTLNSVEGKFSSLSRRNRLPVTREGVLPLYIKTFRDVNKSLFRSPAPIGHTRAMAVASVDRGGIHWGTVRGGALAATFVALGVIAWWVISALSAAGSFLGHAAPLLLLL